MASQVCFDSSTFYTVLIISCAVFVYTLLYPVTVTSAPVAPVRLNIVAPVAPRRPEYADERHFEATRFLHPLVPPLRRGPFNLGPGGRNRHQYGYGSGVFSQMGFLHNPDNQEQAMPLMGRRLHSQQFEYYTFHHNNPDIKIPIKITGDKEINDGDNITVETYGKPFTAKIYDLDTPRYVPY